MPRIVIKLGTGVITCEEGSDLDPERIAKIADGIAAVMKEGHEVLLVSSGAVAAGLTVLNLDTRPSKIEELQACAAVGQCRLMHRYEEIFAARDLSVAQLLLTHRDMESPDSTARIRATIDTLTRSGTIVPIINENDSVAVEELRFGDNDALASHVAILAEADLLILLTTVDGLLNFSPDSPTPTLVERVDDMATARALVGAEKGDLSVGGMTTKLEAAQRAREEGIETIIANGDNAEQIPDLVAGKGRGTRFLVSIPS